MQDEELVVGLESQICLGGCEQAVDEVHDQPQEEMEYQTGQSHDSCFCHSSSYSSSTGTIAICPIENGHFQSKDPVPAYAEALCAA